MLMASRMDDHRPDLVPDPMPLRAPATDKSWQLWTVYPHAVYDSSSSTDMLYTNDDFPNRFTRLLMTGRTGSHIQPSSTKDSLSSSGSRTLWNAREPSSSWTSTTSAALRNTDLAMRAMENTILLL